MANREKDIQISLRISEKEKQLIEQKMLTIGTKNFSMYARKMLIDGYIIRRDFREVKALTKELSEIARNMNQTGNNVNQIAKRVNETGNMYKEDVEDLRKQYSEIKKEHDRMKGLINERLVKVIGSEKPVRLIKEQKQKDDVCENLHNGNNDE